MTTDVRDIGTIGLWTTSSLWRLDADQVAEAARVIDDAGYGAVWIGGMGGDLGLAAAMLDATERMVVASGIVDVWTNPAEDVAANHHRLRAAHPQRFLLGLGSSHAVLTEPATGEPYVRPLQRINAFLDELDQADPPVPEDQRALAALGPRALDLAAARTAGAHPYLVTPEHTAGARERMGEGALLAPEQKVVLETDPATARAVGRRRLANYLTLPNYLNSFRRQGFDDADFADGGSDRLVDAMVAWGDLDAVHKRIAEHLAAGADHVAVQVLSPDPVLPLDGWRRLAAIIDDDA
jgi:probable F420-dependent oxidoreductase